MSWGIWLSENFKLLNINKLSAIIKALRELRKMLSEPCKAQVLHFVKTITIVLLLIDLRETGLLSVLS